MGDVILISMAKTNNLVISYSCTIPTDNTDTKCLPPSVWQAGDRHLKKNEEHTSDAVD